MKTFMYVEINVFALTVLTLIFINIYHRQEKVLIEQKLFLTLLCSNAFVLVLDTAMWVLDGRPGLFSRGIYLFSTICYYIMNPVICMVWSLYADYLICRNEKRIRRFLLPMLIPVFINAILTFFSVFRHYLFYIDGNNVYHRGNLFFVMAAISYFYLVYTLIFIINNRNKIPKQNFVSILVFAFPPFIGGILQSMIYGISLIWICMTVSVLIIFINIQNDQLYTDYLTGLYNRRQLDYYFQQIIQSNKAKITLAGIMIDINSFKMINDLYGHSAGDQALRYTAKILKKTFQKKDFIARFGGDEFVVIVEMKERLDLIRAVEKLKEQIAQFNDLKIVPYTISLSLGYDCFDCTPDMSVKEFIKHIDFLMYQDKSK